MIMTTKPNTQTETPKVKIQLENGQTLSPKEKQRIQEYFKKKERDIVIALTEAELSEFRALLDGRPESEAQLQKFLEQQEKETVTSSEILKWTELSEKLGGIENLEKFTNTIEKTLYKHFFEWDWVLSKANISIDAKHNFITGASFFFMDFLWKKINPDNAWGLEASLINIFWEEWKKWALENLASTWGKIESFTNVFWIVSEVATWNIWEIIAEAYNPEKEALLKEIFGGLEMKENWEKLAIFMNPAKSFDFLDLVYNQNKTKKEIIGYINDVNKNTIENLHISPEQTKKLQQVWENIWKKISPELGASLSKVWEIAKTLEWAKDNIVEQITGNEKILKTISLLTSIPILWDLVKTLLWFLGITDIEWLINGKNFEASKKVISEMIVWKGSIFEWKKIPSDFMQANGNDDTVFLEHIRYLVWDKNWEEYKKWVWALFIKSGEFGSFISNKQVNITFESDTIDYKNLKQAVNVFREYKVEKKKDNSLSVEDFMKRKEEDKKENQDTLEKALALAGAWVGKNNQETETKKTASVTPENIHPIHRMPPKTETKKPTEDKKTNADTPKNPVDEKSKGSPKAETLPWTSEAKKPKPKKNPEAKEQKRNSELIINKPESLTIDTSKVTAIFDVSWTKYKLELLNWHLIVTWWGKIKVFKWWADIISYLQSFNWKLDESARWSHFWKADVKLNWYTVKEILMNWLNEKVSGEWLITSALSERVDQKWLKDIFSENFIEWKNIKWWNITISFNDSNYTFTEKIS